MLKSKANQNRSQSNDLTRMYPERSNRYDCISKSRLPGLGVPAGEWEERSLELFKEYEFTENLSWIPGYSEVWIADMDQPIDRDTDHEEFPCECMEHGIRADVQTTRTRLIKLESKTS